MGKRSMSDDDIVRIFNTVKAMNPGPFKITDVVKDLKKNGFPRPENFMAVLRKQESLNLMALSILKDLCGKNMALCIRLESLN